MPISSRSEEIQQQYSRARSAVIVFEAYRTTMVKAKRTPKGKGKGKASKSKTPTTKTPRSKGTMARPSAAEMARLRKTEKKYAELKAMLLRDLKNSSGLWALDKDASATKPHACSQCSATFTRKDKVVRHVREIHQGIKRKRSKTPEKKRDRSGESAKRWAKMKNQHVKNPALKLKRQMEVAYRTKLYRERKAKKAAAQAKPKVEAGSGSSSSSSKAAAAQVTQPDTRAI